jgi:hypothetical protein
MRENSAQRGRPMTLKAASGRLVKCAITCIAMLYWWMLPVALAAGETPDPNLVNRALANELKAVQEGGHPMLYRLRKSTPRLTSTKQIIETRDGAVARLLTINDHQPNPAERQKDNARLDALLDDPSRQRRRKQSEQDDIGRALKVLRVLPRAFLYEYAGSETNGSITLERYAFSPNPRFRSADLELLVLTAMSGTLAIDVTHERVVRLEGHLLQDVDIGWGILGRLDKGGWITIDQGDVGSGVWRLTRFQMVMSGRVFFKTRSFETIEEESGFAPVPADLTYQRAIQMLRLGASRPTVGGR